MSAFILRLWTKSIGRGRFAVIFAVIGALVFVLPGTINLGLSAAFKGAGPDPAFAILGNLLFGWLSSLGLLALFAVLVIATRMRLRDLELSGALVFMFPMFALPPLSAFLILRMQPLLFVPSASRSPLTSAAVLIDVLLGVALCVTPGLLAGKPLRGMAVERLREWTDCDGIIDLATFRPGAGAALALLLLGTFVDGSGLVTAISATVLFSLCVRRLHGLGKTCLTAGILPLTLSSGTALLLIAMTPLALIPGFILLSAFLLPTLYVMALVFLIYLFKGGPASGSAKLSRAADV